MPPPQARCCSSLPLSWYISQQTRTEVGNRAQKWTCTGESQEEETKGRERAAVILPGGSVTGHASLSLLLRLLYSCLLSSLAYCTPSTRAGCVGARACCVSATDAAWVYVILVLVHRRNPLPGVVQTGVAIGSHTHRHTPIHTHTYRHTPSHTHTRFCVVLWTLCIAFAGPPSLPILHTFLRLHRGRFSIFFPLLFLFFTCVFWFCHSRRGTRHPRVCIAHSTVLSQRTDAHPFLCHWPSSPLSRHANGGERDCIVHGGITKKQNTEVSSSCSSSHTLPPSPQHTHTHTHSCVHT